MWFGNIAYIPTTEGTLYLSTYTDAYSRRVINYRIDNHMRDELVIERLETALLKGKPKVELIIHVDQGSQYTSRRFFEVIQANKLLLSHSKKGASYDNAVMESFYKSLKREVLNKYGFESKAEAVMQLVDYLEE